MSTPVREPLRTRQHRPGDDTRERILAAAAKVLSSQGLARTRLQLIADEAGLRAPAVYYYFASREELILEVLREGQVRVREHVEDALERLPVDAGPRERIAATVEAHLRAELELSDFAAAVVRTAGHLPGDLRGRLAPDVEAYHAIWRELLDSAERAGVLHPGMDLQVARMLVVGALNWAVEWHTPSRPVDLVVTQAQRVVDRALFSF